MELTKEPYIYHFNEWWWGNTITIIRSDGLASIELQFDDNMPNQAFIKGLIVFTTRRKKGYAKELMMLCEDCARMNGAMFLQLSVNKEQDWLKDWYLRLGYTIVCKDEHEFTMLKQI